MRSAKFSFTGSLLAAMLLLTVSMSGCANNPGGEVIPLPNQEVVALSADDVVRVMRRAGFTDDLILEMGTELRNSLASCGASQIRVGNKIEAILAVDGHFLHVSSRRRGSFIYDLRKGAFRQSVPAPFSPSKP